MSLPKDLDSKNGKLERPGSRAAGLGRGLGEFSDPVSDDREEGLCD